MPKRKRREMKDGSPPPSKKRKADLKKAPVQIWWDYENAAIPNDLDHDLVYARIVDKLQENGFTGDVTIKVVVPFTNSTVPKNRDNIRVHYVTNYARPPDAANNQLADEEIKHCISKWLKVKPPQNTMLITGDNDFIRALNQLSMAGHTTMVVCRDSPQHKAASFKLTRIADYYWFLRPFLGLGPSTMNKVARSALFEKKKSEAASSSK